MNKEFQESLDQFIVSQSSRLKGLKPSQGAHVFSPLTIEIKRQDFEKVALAVKGFFSARERLSQTSIDAKTYRPKNYSVLMSYDFHMTEAGPKLIEINTNAGQSLYVHWLYKFKKEPASYLARPFELSLKESFLNEAKIAGLSGEITAAILDDEAEKQFFYPEFLMMADQMESWGWHALVCDARTPQWNAQTKQLALENRKIDFVYNRLTDFYLTDHLNLKSAYEGGLCFSPNPFEYDLLANKNRLVEFSKSDTLKDLVSEPSYFKACDEVLIKTKSIQDLSFDELWSGRKNYFFKPKTSYAGKGAYRGEQIQRRILEEIAKKDYLVQEFIRAPEIEVSTPKGTEKLKYDLRFYVYKDEIQLVSARAYKGQVTNFRTEGSGICTVQVR